MMNQTPLVIGQQQQKVNTVPSTSNPHSKQPPPDLPSQELFTTGTREYYLENGVPLYEAAIKGDWKAAEAVLTKNPQLVRCSVTENGETALHVAVSAKKSKHTDQFVKNLVVLMDKADLLLENQNHNTALYLASAAGNLEAVKIMVDKNKAMLTQAGAGGQMMPLYTAALFGNHEVVVYLYENSHKLRDDGWTPQNRGWLLEKCVENNMFDIAIQILTDRPELAASGSALRALARKPEAFSEPKSGISRTIHSVFKRFYYKVGAPEKETDQALKLLKMIWGAIAKKPKKEIDDILRGPPNPPEMVKHDNKTQPVRAPTKYSSRILFVAAELGNTEFIVELIRLYPDLIWKVNDNNQTIFHIAVKHRHQGIYNLLYEIGAMKDLITPLKAKKNDNNMLHLAGKIAKSKRLQDVSGVALQMQRELLWFQEVKSIMPPSYRERKNKNKQTPHELFTKDHKDLVTEGEKWMKDTASQCMVVAALIATIVFAAAFTVPGGYNQNDGIPMFYQKVTFMVFVVADAISLFASSASILMFLAILTSRYAERDFEESLPRKLMLGLLSLFISIVTMMIAFSVSFFILYHNNLKWMPITITVLAGFPVILYAFLQFPLLLDVFRSTYGSRYLFKPQKQVLYYRNPLH
ncbi:uncharacterized protein [Rutidosis leptorrhynchoides]|uniref:uncharacterized protein n=1 Tax=Rutidosis leptorrhynchoides TaxID=125765 RepID=UPI003A999B6F